MPKKPTTMDRRKLLQSTGIAITSLTLPVANAAATRKKKLPDEANYRASIARGYGPEAAKTTIKTIKKHYFEKEKGEMSQREYHNRVTSDLIESSDAKEVGEDVRKIDEEIENKLEKEDGAKNGNKMLFDSTENSATSQDTISFLNSSTEGSLLLGFYEQDTNGTWASNSDTEVVFGCLDGSSSCTQEACDVMKSRSTAGVYGSTWGEVQFYQEFSPSQSGDYNFDLSYYRKGNSVGGSTSFSIYVKDGNGSIDSKEVESPDGSKNSRRRVNKTFNLNGGENYDVGFEIYTSASTAGGGSFADYYTDDYRVDPNFLMGWEYVG